MNWEKDIRFTEKKVDESWKEQAVRDKTLSETSSRKPAPQDAGAVGKPEAPRRTSKPFMNLLTSLGYQAMMHLGEIPDPATGQPEVNLEIAREMIDLLAAVQEKTAGNLSPEEKKSLEVLVSDLQMKFAARA